MVCPCRVILAGLSAFVAVFLIWHTRESSQKSAVEVPGAGKVRLGRLRLAAACLLLALSLEV